MRRFALLILIGACRARPGAPTCEAVAGQFYALARADLGSATVDPGTHRAVSEQLPAMRDALRDACKDGAWSADVRSCMATARDHAAMQSCEQKLSDAQRAALEKPAP